MKAVRLLVALGFILLVVSCSMKPSWDVIGRWQQEGGNTVLDFSRNGTLLMTSGSTTFTAPFKISESKQLQVDFGLMGALSAQVNVADDVLTLTGAGGKAVKFKKAQPEKAQSSKAQLEKAQVENAQSDKAQPEKAQNPEKEHQSEPAKH